LAISRRADDRAIEERSLNPPLLDLQRPARCNSTAGDSQDRQPDIIHWHADRAGCINGKAAYAIREDFNREWRRSRNIRKRQRLTSPRFELVRNAFRPFRCHLRLLPEIAFGKDIPPPRADLAR